MAENLILCRNIKIPVEFKTKEYHDRCAIEKAQKLYSKTLKNKFGKADFSIYKKSVDARKIDNIFFIYTVAIVPECGISPEKISLLSGDFEFAVNETPSFGNLPASAEKEKPVVVGFGPSGMFCAYALAASGLAPTVIERGSEIDVRTSKVDNYWKNGELDTNTNVQFGEGGAGAFSDGKLLTRIGDPLTGFVMKTLCRHGAPKEIEYLAKPHVGTDNLKKIVKSIRNEIIRLGGNVIFDSAVTSIKTDSKGQAAAVTVNEQYDIECTSLFLCIGHSARDTFSVIKNMGMQITPKAFSVGVRVEHLQSDISKSLYGAYSDCPALEKAQYTLSANDGGRGVYSFCMCPGGIVVASASDNDEIVTNGMSYYSRDGKNSNSAIAVSINPADYGNTVDKAIEFQKNIEKNAYSIAGGDGSAPIQLLGDFLTGSKSFSEPNRILPTYTGKTKVCDVSEIFPSFVNNALKIGFSAFERKIKGFSAADAVLTAPETRTSSPVRINRTECRTAVTSSNIYPCGEGAGYAGGITSAAVDGLKSAMAYMDYLRGIQ